MSTMNATNTQARALATEHNADHAAVLDTAARELFLYATNDGDTYRERVQPVIANLAEHLASRRYDADRARGSWYRVADYAARRYGREFGQGERDGLRMFPPATRRAIVNWLADYYGDEVAEQAADLIGPRELSVSVFDFDRDVNGNPTAHYAVGGVRQTKQRRQVGYSGDRMGGAPDAIAKAGHRAAWYTLDRDSLAGDRSNPAGISAVFRRPAILNPDGMEN